MKRKKQTNKIRSKNTENVPPGRELFNVALGSRKGKICSWSLTHRHKKTFKNSLINKHLLYVKKRINRSTRSCSITWVRGRNDDMMLPTTCFTNSIFVTVCCILYIYIEIRVSGFPVLVPILSFNVKNS